MDPIFLRVLVEELNEELKNTWVVGVDQPREAGILLRLSVSPQRGDKDRGLYLSWDSRYPCLYLCPLAPDKNPPRQVFTRTLKKHLQRAKLVAVQLGEGALEVIMTFWRPWPRVESYRLVLYFGKDHPRASLLTQEGQKVAQYGEEKKVFASPGQKKPHIFDLPDKEALAALLHPWEEGDLAEKLRERTRGLSRLWAKELYLRAECAGYIIDQKEVTLERLFRALGELYFTLNGPHNPYVVAKPLDDGGKQLLALTPLPLLQFPIGWQKKFRTLSQAAEYYYENKIKEETGGAVQQKILKVLRREEKRLHRLEQALKADQAKGEAARDFKLYGELINAQIKTEKAAERGQERIILNNYYQPDNPPLEIPLEPKLTLRQNAQRYFRLYQKYLRGQKIVAGRLGKVEMEISKLESLRTQAERIYELSELIGLRERLIQEGLLDEAPLASKATKTEEPFLPVPKAFHHFITFEGYEILVGKNARENDRLTFTRAGGQDLWLHARGFGGAHVVVRSRGAKNYISDKALEEAAQLAVYFSKARGKGKIPVLYTKVKEVKKPKGSKAGAVTVGRYRTIIVDTEKFNEKILAGKSLGPPDK